MMDAAISQLIYNVNDEPFVVGDDQTAQFTEMYNFLQAFRDANDFIGDPGTGKTHMGKEIAKEYGRRNNVPAYYTVIDEDTTKGSVLMGHRLVEGSLKTVAAVVGAAMQTGGVVFVDELTHGMLSVQSIFNTVADQDSVTSVGDIMLSAHPKFRVIFGHNTTQHPGNSGIKTSFGSRLMCWPFEYPEPRTETKIVKSIVWKEDDGRARMSTIPDSVTKYLVSWARNVRSVTNNYIPVSSRNIAAVCKLLSTLPRDTNATLAPKFVGGTASEPIRRKIAEWCTFQPAVSDADLISPRVGAVLKFITEIGEERFVRAVLQGSMYHLPLDGLSPGALKNYREQMKSTVI